MAVEAFPLQWPTGRKRMERWQREVSAFRLGMAAARDDLFAELSRLGARNFVLSSNVALRRDGLPYAGQPNPDDPGVAAYFEYKGRAMCFACDRWTKVEDNIRAIGKTIEALRGIARWGTGDMMAAAFNGFEALPAPGAKREWWEVLGVPRNATRETVRQAYRTLASTHHPDRGGSHERMAELNAAQEKALQECSA